MMKGIVETIRTSSGRGIPRTVIVIIFLGDVSTVKAAMITARPARREAKA